MYWLCELSHLIMMQNKLAECQVPLFSLPVVDIIHSFIHLFIYFCKNKPLTDRTGHNTRYDLINVLDN